MRDRIHLLRAERLLQQFAGLFVLAAPGVQGRQVVGWLGTVRPRPGQLLERLEGRVGAAQTGQCDRPQEACVAVARMDPEVIVGLLEGCPIVTVVDQRLQRLQRRPRTLPGAQ